MRKIILVLVLLSQSLMAQAFFSKPRVKLNHDLTNDSLIMALDSGKKITVEFHNVALCGKKRCYNTLEVGDSLKDTIKVIGYDTTDKLDKGDKQAHHTIEVIYNAKAVNGYVTLKDAKTDEVLNRIKVIVRADTYCHQAKTNPKGKITFPDGNSYILNFPNQCELERAGATPYEAS